MKTVYGPVSVPTPSPDVEIAVDTPEMEEVAFTLITNKKYKDKGKVFFFFWSSIYYTVLYRSPWQTIYNK